MVNSIEDVIDVKEKTECYDNKVINCEEEIRFFKDNKVWVTKKARMEAENRVLRNDRMANVIINYYNLLVLSVSIYTLIWESKIGVVLTTIVSVGLFGISNYINSMNYKESAFKYRESYLRLSKIETKLDNLILKLASKEEKLSEFNKIKEEYDNILELSYNHSEIDYTVVAIQSDRCNKDYIQKYNWYKIKFNVGIFIILILPLIIVGFSISIGSL